MALQVGAKAPDFQLYDTDKNLVSLSSLKGKPVVLLFFPMAFTGVCTAEMCNVRDGLGSYQALNATVLGISVDSPFTLAKFRETEHLNFPLLSDFNKEVSASYGALYETFALGLKGVSKRSAFVIDKQGVIQYAEVLENAGEQPSFEAIQKALQQLS